MDISHNDILEILEIVETAKVDYFELEVGDFKVLLDRSSNGLSPSIRTRASEVEAPRSREQLASDPPNTTDRPAVVGVGQGLSSGVQATTPSSAEPTGFVVVSPMVGVFYSAPEPGSEPYVRVGDRVTAETTVALIEVMKVFNSVTAGIEGIVEQTLVSNEDFVEFGQPLMTIRPLEG